MVLEVEAFLPYSITCFHPTFTLICRQPSCISFAEIYVYFFFLYCITQCVFYNTKTVCDYTGSLPKLHQVCSSYILRNYSLHWLTSCILHQLSSTSFPFVHAFPFFLFTVPHSVLSKSSHHSTPDWSPVSNLKFFLVSFCINHISKKKQENNLLPHYSIHQTLIFTPLGLRCPPPGRLSFLWWSSNIPLVVFCMCRCFDMKLADLKGSPFKICGALFRFLHWEKNTNSRVKSLEKEREIRSKTKAPAFHDLKYNLARLSAIPYNGPSQSTEEEPWILMN